MRFQHAKIEAPLKKAFSRTKMMIDRAVMQIEAKDCWTTPETRVEWLRMCGLWLWRDSDTSTFKKPPKILHFIVICLRRIGRLSHSHLRLLCQFVTHSTLRLDHSHRCPTSTGWTKEESCVVFFFLRVHINGVSCSRHGQRTQKSQLLRWDSITSQWNWTLHKSITMTNRRSLCLDSFTNSMSLNKNRQKRMRKMWKLHSIGQNGKKRRGRVGLGFRLTQSKKTT